MFHEILQLHSDIELLRAIKLDALSLISVRLFRFCTAGTTTALHRQEVHHEF